MIYYRVALQTQQPSSWKWNSSVLASLEALLLYLKTYCRIPKENILVFFSSSAEVMDEMLTRQNEGLISSSITADQLLASPMLSPQEIRRLEFELRNVGDHDEPYTFTLPTYMPEALAWAKLLAKLQSGELQQ